MVPPVITASLSGSVAGRLAHRHDRGHLRLRSTPMRTQQVVVPAPVRVERPERRRDAGVDGGHARKGVGGDRLAGPVAPGVGTLDGRPAQEALGVGHGPGQQRRGRAPVRSRPGPPGRRRGGRAAPGTPRRFTAVSEGTMEATATPASDAPLRRRAPRSPRRMPSRPGAPGPLGVVAQDVGLGRHDAVGHPAAGHHRPVLVDGQRLHRRRADVDADGDGRRGRLMKLTPRVMIRSLCLVGVVDMRIALLDAVTCCGVRGSRGVSVRSLQNLMPAATSWVWAKCRRSWKVATMPRTLASRPKSACQGPRACRTASSPLVKDTTHSPELAPLRPGCVASQVASTSSPKRTEGDGPLLARTSWSSGAAPWSSDTHARSIRHQPRLRVDVRPLEPADLAAPHAVAAARPIATFTAGSSAAS